MSKRLLGLGIIAALAAINALTGTITDPKLVSELTLTASGLTMLAHALGITLKGQ